VMLFSEVAEHRQVGRSTGQDASQQALRHRRRNVAVRGLPPAGPSGARRDRRQCLHCRHETTRRQPEFRAAPTTRLTGPGGLPLYFHDSNGSAARPSPRASSVGHATWISIAECC
jgi:hypothetical protein